MQLIPSANPPQNPLSILKQKNASTRIHQYEKSDSLSEQGGRRYAFAEEEINQTKSKDITYVKLWHRFKEKTTSHGVSHIADAAGMSI